jgi:hypothetical protein
MTKPAARDRRGPDKSPSGPREAGDPGSRRHATNAGSGANEPKREERKEQRRWVSRQGGDQTRGDAEGDDR